MGLVLPGALTWVLDLLGIDWPNVDEDDLTSGATELRQIAGDLTGSGDQAQSAVAQMLSGNSSQSLDLFDALWQKLAGSHLPQLAEAMKALAAVLDVSAGVVVAMKAAAIAQLAILAAEIISDQAEAVVTFGASEAEIPIQIAATRGITKEIFDQAIKQVEQQILQAVEGPIFSALGDAAENLATQLVGDALGTNSGIDLGQVASAGSGGFQQGMETLTSNPLGAVGLTTTGGTQ